MRAESPSSTALFQRCPASYNRRYNLLEPQATSEPAREGQSLHAVFEAYLRHCTAQGYERDEDAMPRIAGEVLAGSGVVPERIPEMQALCEKFLTAYSLPPQERLVGAEVWIPPEGKSLLIGGKFPVRNRLDVLSWLDMLDMETDQDVPIGVIDDFKSGWALPPAGENALKDDWPAQFNAFTALQMYPKWRGVKVRHFYLRYAAMRETWFDRRGMEPFEIFLWSLLRKIAGAKEFPRNPGGACSWCDYAQPCVGATTWDAGKEEPENLLKEILSLDAGIERHRAALKAWCKENGPVTADGKTIGYLPSESKKILPADLIGAVGLDRAMEALKVELKALGKLALSQEERLFVEGLKIVETKTKFEIKKIKEEEKHGEGKEG